MILYTKTKNNQKKDNFFINLDTNEVIMYEFYQLSRPINVISLYSFFAPTYSPTYYYSGERHDFWEFVFVQSGSLKVTEDEKIYELSAGEIIFHKPMEFHRLWTAGEKQVKLIIASFTASGEGMDGLGEGVFCLDKSDIALLKEAADIAKKNIFNERSWKKDFISQQLVSNKLETMMLNILKNKKATLRESESTVAVNYKKIITAMNENIDKSLSVDDFAKIVNMSSANLKKSFKKYSGMGIIGYFNRLKLMRAQSMIKEGFSMSEISESLGFSSQNYFSTSFKREFGISPLQYKKENTPSLH